jgi:hypothetical protein
MRANRAGSKDLFALTHQNDLVILEVAQQGCVLREFPEIDSRLEIEAGWFFVFSHVLGLSKVERVDQGRGRRCIKRSSALQSDTLPEVAD